MNNMKKYTGFFAITLQLLFLSFMVCNMTACTSCASKTEPSITPTTSKYVLPFIGEKDYDYDLDGQIIDTLFHTIPPFYFTAHDSSIITNETVKGKIYVADFFFTNCPSICPIMTGNMKTFHENTKDIDELIILSHTIDPGRDTLARLNAYIAEKEVNTRNDWFFLYASQEYTYDIGKHGYKVNADVDEKAEGGFLHSEYFMLIDREGRIRGAYDGTNPEEVTQLEIDIRLLIEKEYGE